MVLNTRYKPEQKYEFPVTSSMQYGWRMYDERNKLLDERMSGDTQAAVKHGIRNLVINSFYRQNGVLDENKAEEVIKPRPTFL